MGGHACGKGSAWARAVTVTDSAATIPENLVALQSEAGRGRLIPKPGISGKRANERFAPTTFVVGPLIYSS
jgi:hypothetical protein